jgi:hypothetical protein
MALTQTAAYEELRSRYGGSDSTLPSFLRPYYTKYNAITKSLDLGTTDILIADLGGQIGSQAGASTLYFKVVLPRRVDLQVRKRSTGAFTDRFVSVGILDADRNPVPIDTAGYGYQGDRYDTSIDESLLGLPAGLYYITVSSNQWQSVPYAITISVGRYALLDGAALGRAPLAARIPLIKIAGPATGTLLGTGTLVNPNAIKEATGTAGGAAVPALTLTIMRGAAGGSMLPSGRLKATWRLSGAATGTSASTGTLTSEIPYGGGYGY